MESKGFWGQAVQPGLYNTRDCCHFRFRLFDLGGGCGVLRGPRGGGGMWGACMFLRGSIGPPMGGVALLWGVQGCRGGIDGPSMDVQPLLGIQGPARLWGAAVGSHRDPIGPVGPHSAWLGGASPSKYGDGHAHVGSHAPRPRLPPRPLAPHRLSGRLRQSASGVGGRGAKPLAGAGEERALIGRGAGGEGRRRGDASRVRQS